MAERKKIDQPRTEVWLGEDGLLYVEQKADSPYSDVPGIVTLDPKFVPLFVSWLLELIAPEAVG